MNCPFRSFEPCPEHNKVGGCSFWMNYIGNKDSIEVSMEGCAVVLTPMLLLDNANNLGIVASEVSKVGAEVSFGRTENIREQQANRQQFVHLAQGHKELIHANHKPLGNKTP